VSRFAVAAHFFAGGRDWALFFRDIWPGVRPRGGVIRQWDVGRAFRIGARGHEFSLSRGNVSRLPNFFFQVDWLWSGTLLDQSRNFRSRGNASARKTFIIFKARGRSYLLPLVFSLGGRAGAKHYSAQRLLVGLSPWSRTNYGGEQIFPGRIFARGFRRLGTRFADFFQLGCRGIIFGLQVFRLGLLFWPTPCLEKGEHRGGPRGPTIFCGFELMNFSRSAETLFDGALNGRLPGHCFVLPGMGPGAPCAIGRPPGGPPTAGPRWPVRRGAHPGKVFRFFLEHFLRELARRGTYPPAGRSFHFFDSFRTGRILDWGGSFGHFCHQERDRARLHFPRSRFSAATAENPPVWARSFSEPRGRFVGEPLDLFFGRGAAPIGRNAGFSRARRNVFAGPPAL